MIYCGRCRKELEVGDKVTRIEVGLVYEGGEGDRCSVEDAHAVFLQHRGSCAEKVEERPADEKVTAETRTYRLTVSGTVQFTNADREIEELLLAGIYQPQQPDQSKVVLSRAIQSLEEEATEHHVGMTRI